MNRTSSCHFPDRFVERTRTEWYRRLWQVWLFLVYFFVAWAIHHSGFKAPFYYDSAARLSQNQYSFEKGISETVNIFRQRPIPMVTFYLNYLAAGMTPRPYRICNAAILAVASVVLVALIVILLETSWPDTNVAPSQVRWVAAFLGLVFLVHPVQTYVVVYIWQRMALLACLFSVASLWAYVATRRSIHMSPHPNSLPEGDGASGVRALRNAKPISNRCIRSHGIAKAALGYSCSALFFLLALASKENSVAMPFVMILAEIAFFRDTRRTIIARSAVILAVALISVAFLSFLESPHGLQESSGIVETLARYYRESRMTVAEVALTQCRVLFSYLGMILFPFPSSVRLFSPQIISKSLLDPAGTLPALVGTGVLVITSLYMLRRRPLTGFGLLFFLLNLLPESLLVPQYQFFGYRVVLPMAGLLLVVADLLMTLMERIRSSSRRVPVTVGLLVAYAAVIVFMVSTTVTKARLWTNPVAFWKEVVDRLPMKSQHGERAATQQALTSLGMSLLQQGKPSEAIAPFRQLLAIDPMSFSALVSLGNAYTAQGNTNEAESFFRKALEIDPKSADAHVALGRLFMGKGRSHAAIAQFDQALELAPDNPLAHYELGRAHIAAGRFRKAVPHLRKAADKNPRNYEAQYALGKALMKMGDYQSATASLQKVLEIKPDHWKSHNDIGVIWGIIGRPDKAVPHFRQALEINPQDVPTKRNLETALRQIKHPGGGTP